MSYRCILDIMAHQQASEQQIVVNEPIYDVFSYFILILT